MTLNSLSQIYTQSTVLHPYRWYDIDLNRHEDELNQFVATCVHKDKFYMFLEKKFRVLKVCKVEANINKWVINLVIMLTIVIKKDMNALRKFESNLF